MKNEEEIRRQLEKVYEHRLGLRIERKTRPCCRNCKNGICQEFDLGDFGAVSRWQCREGKEFGEDCGFCCANSVEEIERGMIADISNPSICGAKEPKIAMLLWVLHGSSKSVPACDSVPSGQKGGADVERGSSAGSVIASIKRLFSFSR